MCNLNQPINVTRVIEFQPGSKYLFVINWDTSDVVSMAQLNIADERTKTAIGRLLEGSSQFEIIASDSPIDITAYQFKPVIQGQTHPCRCRLVEKEE